MFYYANEVKAKKVTATTMCGFC